MFLSFRDLNLKSLKENPQDWKVFWPKTTCPLIVKVATKGLGYENEKAIID